MKNKLPFCISSLSLGLRSCILPTLTIHEVVRVAWPLSIVQPTMKRVFGGRDNNDDDGPSDRPSSSYDDTAAANERSRLLPNRVDSDVAYLSPDDPAVTPYNLYTVRFTRYLTIFFTFITFLWWTLLLISLFITPPGLSTRGSGFYGFSYASVALTNLVVLLLFFSAPSKAARVLAVVTAALLLVNMILIVAVPKIRHEEIWTGVAGVVWALLVSLWTLLADRTVQWGKAEEEQRLTGREESRRSLLEWIEVLLSTIFLTLLAVIALLLTCTLIQRAVDAQVTPPGTLYWVDGDKYQVHLHCYGNVTDATGEKLPTVLFEGGEDPVENGPWQLLDNAVANGSFSRYCFADRPGMAWVSLARVPGLLREHMLTVNRVTQHRRHSPPARPPTPSARPLPARERKDPGSSRARALAPSTRGSSAPATGQRSRASS